MNEMYNFKHGVKREKKKYIFRKILKYSKNKLLIIITCFVSVTPLLLLYFLYEPKEIMNEQKLMNERKHQ